MDSLPSDNSVQQQDFIDSALNEEEIKRQKRKEYGKQWYEKNKEKRLKQCAEYRENNKEKIKEKSRKWYEKNRERVLKQQKEYNKQKPKKVKPEPTVDELLEKEERKKLYQKEYYEKNKERKLNQIKNNYQKNKEQILERERKYREENKEQIAKRRKIFYDNNKEELLAKQRARRKNNLQKYRDLDKKSRRRNKHKVKLRSKQYYEANKEKINNYNKQYIAKNKDILAQKNKEYRIRNIDKIRNYRHSNRGIYKQQSQLRRERLLNQNDGTLTAEFIKAIYDDADFCIYCGKELLDVSGDRNDIKTLDHVIALSRGGLHSKSNVVVCCFSCNVKKGNMSYATWLTKLKDSCKTNAEKLYVDLHGSLPSIDDINNSL